MSLIFNNTDLFNDCVDNEIKSHSVVHIRKQQRTAKKTFTIIEGLAEDLDQKKILKFLRKELNTNGAVLKVDENDKNSNDIIQLQGDCRQKIKNILLLWNICDKDDIILIHG
jgi:translation initiation factor SUI1